MGEARSASSAKTPLNPRCLTRSLGNHECYSLGLLNIISISLWLLKALIPGRMQPNCQNMHISKYLIKRGQYVPGARFAPAVTEISPA